ncbi:MAG: 16S rRNA (uracil(1498)-N(3))-methyltransferase [Syntrophomonadaceae bacterium]|nr:16S rRNA (uracil(1498)-N(3))-methyltransferase [Syntrophomonadaceae bacterium]
MHRFFMAKIAEKGQPIIFDREQSRHIRKVLRLRGGTEIEAFDGQGGVCRAVLRDVNAEKIIAEVTELLHEERESPLKVILCQGLAKGERMDTILQKAVELGAAGFQPFISRHAVVELSGERAEKKMRRWQSIVLEACKQCRRNTIPPVAELLGFNALLNVIGAQPAIMLYENETARSLKQVLQQQREDWRGQSLYLIVGPEGGFAPEEAELAQARGIHLAGLGPRILRTETAGPAALAAIMYEFDGLGKGLGAEQ